MANTYRKLGDNAYSANFERQKAAPLDATQLVKGFAHLTDATTFISSNGNNYSYFGMIVSVVDDNSLLDGLYRLINTDPTNPSWTAANAVTDTNSWQKIGDGGSGSHISADTITVSGSITSPSSTVSNAGEGSIALGTNNTVYANDPRYPQFVLGEGNEVNADMTTFTVGMYNKNTATHGAYVEGYGNYAAGNFQHVQGKWNIKRGGLGDSDYVADIIGGGKGGYSKWHDVNEFIAEFQSIYGYNPVSDKEDGEHKYPIWFGTRLGKDTTESTFAGYVDWTAAMYLYKVIPYHTSEPNLSNATIGINISETNWFGDQHNVGYITAKNITSPRIQLNPTWVRDNAFYIVSVNSQATQVFDNNAGYAIIEGLRRYAGKHIIITANNFKGGNRNNCYYSWLTDNADVDTFPNGWSTDSLNPVEDSDYNFTSYRIYIDGAHDKLFISNNFSKFANPDVYIEEELGSDNIFYRKNITVIGDSITARGKGIGLQWQDYLTRAGAKTVTQFAGSGWTLACTRGAYNCIAKMLHDNTSNINNTIANSDIVIICAGINDYLSADNVNVHGYASGGRILGIPNEKLATYNGSITFGSQSFYQGVEYINWFFATNYSTKRLIFVLPFDTSSIPNNDGLKAQSLQDFRNAIGQSAAYYGNDIVSVDSICSMNPVSTIKNNYYYQWFDTNNIEHIDGLHPGYYGHKEIGTTLLNLASEAKFNNPTNAEPVIGRYYYDTSQRRRGVSFGAHQTNTATGLYSLVSGRGCYATGENSASFGQSSGSTGSGSFSAGGDAQARGQWSVALNAFTQANSQHQLVFGHYNKPDNNNVYACICGNGTNKDAGASNAFAVRWDGTFEIARAIQLPVYGTNEFVYMIMNKDENGYYQSYLTEEEYNALTW